MSGEEFRMLRRKFDIRGYFTVKCPVRSQNVQWRTGGSPNKMSGEFQMNFAYSVSIGCKIFGSFASEKVFQVFVAPSSAYKFGYLLAQPSAKDNDFSIMINIMMHLLIPGLQGHQNLDEFRGRPLIIYGRGTQGEKNCSDPSRKKYVKNAKKCL